MKNKKITASLTFFIIFAVWMFLFNRYLEHYSLNKSIIMSLGASLLATILLSPINKLILWLKQKSIQKEV